MTAPPLLTLALMALNIGIKVMGFIALMAPPI
jgi:hypothetical protein